MFFHTSSETKRALALCLHAYNAELTDYGSTRSSKRQRRTAHTDSYIYMLIWLLSFVFGIFALNFLARSQCFFRNIFKCMRTLACINISACCWDMVAILMFILCVIISPTIRTFLHFVDVRHKYYKKKESMSLFYKEKLNVTKFIF